MDSNPNKLPAALLAEIRSQSERNIVGGDLAGLLARIKSDFDDSVCGIILYGSCLRTHTFHEGVVDLYVVVSNYKTAYKTNFLRALNSLLPPNVFYFECGEKESKIRAKYAVISLEDLHKGIYSWFHSYIWSRFAQPVRLLYARNDKARLCLYSLIAQSVIKFLKTTVPALGPGRFDTETIWMNALSLSYSAELRPEQENRAKFITHQSLGDFIRLTQNAAPALPGLLQPLASMYYQSSTADRDQKRCRRQWKLRRWQGRILSILRLLKAVFTFKDCVDYAAWKIHRHTGIDIKVTPALQRHPILFGINILWKLLRRDALH